jgi:hypothetical protein
MAIPDPPSRDDCIAQPGIKQVTNGGWVEKVAGLFNSKVEGGSRTWVLAGAREFQFGGKFEMTGGRLLEDFDGTKNELILLNENKLVIGAATEASLAIRLELKKSTETEFDCGPKLEFIPRNGFCVTGGLTRKAAERREKIAKAEKVLGEVDKVIGTCEIDAGTLERAVGTLDWHANKVKENASEYYLKAKNAKVQSDDHKRTVSGAEKQTGSPYKAEATGSAKLNGKGKAEIKAGKKIECKGGKVFIDGTNVTVKK